MLNATIRRMQSHCFLLVSPPLLLHLLLFFTAGAAYIQVHLFGGVCSQEITTLKRQVSTCVYMSII